MSDMHYLGEITMFGGNYPPRGWAFCDGAELDISQHSALYAVIGNIYGGNHIKFNLPNLKGRFPVHRGGQFIQGFSGGFSQITLNIDHMPSHTHDFRVFSDEGTEESPVNNILADADSRYPTNVYAPMPSSPDKIAYMNKSALSTVGGNLPIPTTPPYTTINFIICIDGVFPSRS